MFDDLVAAVGSARGAAARLLAFTHIENAACSARLSLMADMLAAAYAADGSAEREQWRFDNWSAVCARIGAAHDVTTGVASGLLQDAVTLRERLPRVAEVFAEGRISYRLVHTICLRTVLVKDEAALRAIDAELSVLLRDWGARSVDQTERDIDTLILRHDPYALRRSESRSRGSHVDVHVDGSGTAYLDATLSATDGKAVDRRVDLLARTVCERDPRTLDQRRGAALGAMGFGWDRLPCMCEHPDCDATSTPSVGGVVIHVIARETTPGPNAADASASTLNPPGGSEPEPSSERTTTPAVGDAVAQRRALAGKPSRLLPKPWHSYDLAGLTTALAADCGKYAAAGPAVILGGAVLPGAVVGQAEIHAASKTLVHPGQAPPEPRYRPSTALADFVRCRDLTCRFPGCSRPATVADLDHTIPYPYGPTCASNMVCLCREHHLLKTFWPGWHSEQHPDGTLVWTDPDGHTYATRPGSLLLFPELSVPTAGVRDAKTPPAKHIARPTMPRRTITRAEARRRRIDDERRRNLELRENLGGDTSPPF